MIIGFGMIIHYLVGIMVLDLAGHHFIHIILGLDTIIIISIIHVIIIIIIIIILIIILVIIKLMGEQHKNQNNHSTIINNDHSLQPQQMQRNNHKIEKLGLS